MGIAVVMPALDEAERLADSLAPVLGCADAVIVADGASRDRTACIADSLGAQVIQAPRGRARQMNAGAQWVDEDVILFLHADTRLPPDWRTPLIEAVRGGFQWGRFDVRLDDPHPLLTCVGALMNLRSAWTGICTGDQAIFVTREAWTRCGGYPDIPLMEDLELSSRLRTLYGRPARIRAPVIVSARRWRTRGMVRTIVQMWWLRLRWFLGADPHDLHRAYYGRRS